MPIVVHPAEDLLEDPCTELWYDPAKITIDSSVEATVAQTAVLEATWVIKQLTGGVFSGAQCLVEEYAVRHGQTKLDVGRPIDQLLYARSFTPCDGDDDGTDLSNACIVRPTTIRLRQRGCCGATSGFPGGFHVSYDMVGPPCPERDRAVRVAYRTRPNIPPGAGRVVKKLAEEYVKAVCGDKSCKLPERITSVTRQGVSWSLLDPQEFLDRGLVGIGAVDHWLNVATQTARGLAMVDPLERGVLIRSAVEGCGGDCEVDES